MLCQHTLPTQATVVAETAIMQNDCEQLSVVFQRQNVLQFEKLRSQSILPQSLLAEQTLHFSSWSWRAF